ncbi:YhjD/YihY/BrkB family envelope integrity protein [Nocardioides sp.]|uniref:YhjD/YihY/BrkB family envelope integrity protein n=1 Tax=Nocardioides sp. TaxID=35761 RepID=UPI0027260312|nr:YhjD/YihY/BrkB family envelope integrity protein [Nocardioides sp.]MDO9455422.1 YhjD/YihY/BrkB family envelope integrity protein [Nocardioides sp.]
MSPTTRRWRELLMASHKRYTRANGDALAGSATYSLLVGLVPVLLLVGTVLGWAGTDGSTVAAGVRRAADRTLPNEVADVVVTASADLDRSLTWVSAAIILWLSVRSVRALRTAFRAACGQDNGSGNPVLDNLRDVWLAAVLYAAATLAVVVVAAMPSRLSGEVAGAVLLTGLVGGAMWLLPWADSRRPSAARTTGAAVGASAVVLLLGTVGGAYIDHTMPGRSAVFGAVATLVATALWVALSVRAVLRSLSIASVAEEWAQPAPPDDRVLWVVVPAYQEAVGIGATLEALAAQDDLRFALVVADNASTDGTVAVVEAFAVTAPFPVHVVVETERGVGCAVDTAVRLALEHGAELVARTDADALPHPDWVRRIRDRFARGAEVVAGASVPRRDEHPTPAERFVLPAVQRLLAVYGRHRGEHRGPDYLAPYVLTHGHSFAITADVYVRSGGAVRQALEAGSEDVALLNRARRVTPHVVRADEVVVENSLRRLRQWGVRNTLLWYWDRRYVPPTADEVHVR